MKYFMRFTEGVDRFQQALWFIENYQDIRIRQADIDWLKGNKKYIYDEYNVGMQIPNTVSGFMWIGKGTPWNYFNINSMKEVFYNADITTLGELSCTI